MHSRANCAELEAGASQRLLQDFLEIGGAEVDGFVKIVGRAGEESIRLLLGGNAAFRGLRGTVTNAIAENGSGLIDEAEGLLGEFLFAVAGDGFGGFGFS